MMRMMMKKSIRTLLFLEAIIIPSAIYSFVLFINVQVAFLSSLFIVLGSSFAYKRMVQTQVDSAATTPERDLLDTIEDPHELFDETEINHAPAEELDLKKIVKEEKAKVKLLSVKNMKHGARGSMSAFRLVPYLFLVLGFIALENNALLHLSFYLPALFVGIIAGSLLSKGLMSTQ